MIFCCTEMEQNINELSGIHYNDIFDEYGLICHEDNESVVILKYCPWCGKKLPSSKREEWFERLEELGFDDPMFDACIPSKFKTSEWRKGQEYGSLS